MKKQLYIIGAGSVGGHLALNIKQYSEEYEVEGFFDDDPELIGTNQFGYNVIGPVFDAAKLNNVALVIGIAFPETKKKILNRFLGKSELTFPSFVHDRSWISGKVKIGKGSIIYPGVSINYGSKIGDFAVINMNCALGHHTKIGSYSSLAPGVSTGGHTEISESVEMGIGSATLQDIRIGGYSVVGGKSMVTKNVEPNSKVVGVPARQI